jgi:hypothetical protein
MFPSTPVFPPSATHLGAKHFQEDSPRIIFSFHYCLCFNFQSFNFRDSKQGRRRLQIFYYQNAASFLKDTLRFTFYYITNTTQMLTSFFLFFHSTVRPNFLFPLSRVFKSTEILLMQCVLKSDSSFKTFKHFTTLSYLLSIPSYHINLLQHCHLY